MTGEDNLDRRIGEVDDTISALERYWFQHPEMRLGQILENIARIGGRRRDTLWDLTELEVQAGLAYLGSLNPQSSPPGRFRARS